MRVRTGPRWERSPAGELTKFIDAHERAWELGMGALALAYLSISFADDGSSGGWSQPIVLCFVAIFALEFAVRCWAAKDRWAYVRLHWLDLVSCIPLVGGLRALRLLRLVKLLIPLKVLTSWADVRLLARDSMWFLLPSLVLLWVGSAYAIWIFEHGVNPHVRTYLDAVYWSFITVTSLGYGSYPPVTTPGHILAGILVFLGVGIVGAASSRLTALWMHEKESNDAAKVSASLRRHTKHEFDELHEAMVTELNQLRSEITELRSLLVLTLHDSVPLSSAQDSLDRTA